LSKDLGKGGSNFPDPLIVFRNIGNFTKQELDQIDEVIQQSPFDNIDIISRRVFDFIRKIRPDGFRPGFRSGKSVKGIMNLINKKFGKDTMKVADEIERPGLVEDFERLTQKLDDLPPPGSRGGPDDIAAPFQSAEETLRNADVPIELITADVLKVKYPGIPDELAQMIGNDTNLQRKAEAIATIEQALALKGAGKSSDELIEILNREPEIKMSKGGLAKILEM